MAIEILVPRLGWSMEEGTLVEWLKRDGDAVQPGDLLFVLEGDKALNEVECFDAGILRIPPDSPAPGTTIPVGTLLAYVVRPDEPAPFEAAGGAPSSAGATAMPGAVGKAPESKAPESKAAPDQPATAETTEAPHAPAGRAAPAISPRARRVAAELGVDWARVRGSGRTGRIVERDVRAAHAAQAAAQAAAIAAPRVDASPLARRAAEELGVDLPELGRRLPGKRIERADVEAAAAAEASRPAEPAPAEPAPAAEMAARSAPISPLRRVIAERMAAGAHTAAPVTLTTEADATELVRLRHQLKADQPAGGPPQSVPSYTDLLVAIAARALQEHPALNARLEGDRIVTEAAAHVGVAVDTERGLLVAVVRDAHAKAVRQIAAETERLIARAREGRLSADEMRGGTFTVTNLGMYEIDAFTPILNLPECAILGLGRVVARQVVVDDTFGAERVAVRRMMALSLTFDHRLVDGAPAARFLQRVKRLVEQPYLWLAR